MAIKSCTCKHEYQDKRYGQGQRVHNPGKGPNGEVRWICTVCGTKK